VRAHAEAGRGALNLLLISVASLLINKSSLKFTAQKVASHRNNGEATVVIHFRVLTFLKTREFWSFFSKSEDGQNFNVGICAKLK